MHHILYISIIIPGYVKFGECLFKELLYCHWQNLTTRSVKVTIKLTGNRKLNSYFPVSQRTTQYTPGFLTIQWLPGLPVHQVCVYAQGHQAVNSAALSVIINSLLWVRGCRCGWGGGIKVLPLGIAWESRC